MTSHKTAVLLGVFAAFAICLVGSASASASQWYVKGAPLTGSTALAESAKVEESITLTMYSGEIKITCTSLAVSEGTKNLADLVAPNTLTTYGLRLGGCSLAGPAGCKVSKTIETEPLVATFVTGTAPSDSVELKSKGNVFMEIEYEGVNCPGGDVPYAGKFTLLAPKGQEELAEQTLPGQGSKESPVGMKSAGQPVYLGGKFKLKLASGFAWSFH